jgi:hypothetical protein
VQKVAAMRLLGRCKIFTGLTILGLLALDALSQDDMEVSDPELNNALMAAEEQQETGKAAAPVQAQIIKRAPSVPLMFGTGDISTTGRL